MNRKILIAVDGSPSSRQALDYVALLAGDLLADLSVTLFYVLDYVPQPLARESMRDPQLLKLAQQLAQRSQKRGQEVLEQSRERLVQQGMSDSQIELKAHARGLGLAKDILFEGMRGNYDAVVLGRRGLSRLEEYFLGSVTNKVAQHADRVPVWVVGTKVASRRVLCAVDCSPGSLRAVDHLAFMLGGCPESDVTLFHAGADLGRFYAQPQGSEEAQEAARLIAREDSSAAADFCLQARTVLEEGGLMPDRIKVVSRARPNGVTQAILEELAAGGYGTVVLGRRGEGRAFWLGHVSDKVLARCDGAAVWIVG